MLIYICALSLVKCWPVVLSIRLHFGQDMHIFLHLLHGLICNIHGPQRMNHSAIVVWKPHEVQIWGFYIPESPPQSYFIELHHERVSIQLQAQRQRHKVPHGTLFQKKWPVVDGKGIDMLFVSWKDNIANEESCFIFIKIVKYRTELKRLLSQ